MKKFFLFLFLINLFSLPSHAYVGPGMGGGLLAGVIGFLFAIFALIFGLLWFPLKRLIKNIKANNPSADDILDINPKLL